MKLKQWLTTLIVLVLLSRVKLLPAESADYNIDNEEDLDDFKIDESYEDSDSLEDEDVDNDPDDATGDVFQFQGDDDSWHTIYLNASLDSDDMYDYSNFSKLMEDTEPLTSTSFRSVQKYVTPQLFTNEHPDEPFELTTVNGRESPLNTNHPTKVIVHGWLERGGKMWLMRMKDKYLLNGNHNVIALDWESWAKKEYTISARRTRKIGAYLGQVLMNLITAEKIRPEQIHITGHSLGAHIAGIAAKTIKAQTGHKIGRITGLDPARPLFEYPYKVKAKKRLDKNDAELVDVIHTCGGSLGVKKSFGHVDFYPNKGKPIQPGCGILKNHICSHARAYTFYTESINSDKFKAVACSSWRKYKRGKCKKNPTVSMGFFLDKNVAAGKYFLKTKRKAPFAKG